MSLEGLIMIKTYAVKLNVIQTSKSGGDLLIPARTKQQRLLELRCLQFVLHCKQCVKGKMSILQNVMLLLIFSRRYRINFSFSENGIVKILLHTSFQLVIIPFASSFYLFYLINILYVFINHKTSFYLFYLIIIPYILINLHNRSTKQTNYTDLVLFTMLIDVDQFF